MKTEQTIQLCIPAPVVTVFCDKLMDESVCDLQAYYSLRAIKSLLAANHVEIPDNKHLLTMLDEQVLVAEKKHLETSSVFMLKGLKQCNAALLAMLHNLLDRNGFYHLFEKVIAELSDDDIRLLMVWSANWVKEAAQLSKENQLIDQQEYRAMMDLDKVLNPQ